MLSGLNGLTIIKDATLVDVVGLSWARVRSPGRARRRLKRGFKQNIDQITEPKSDLIVTATHIIGHPATVQKMLDLIPQSKPRHRNGEPLW